MKKFTIELSDDSAAAFEEIAKMNNVSVKDLLQSILQRIIETHKKTFFE
ncbi:MAG: hypothetical protein FWD16_07910 [Clostridia bacterium]|nr:hypothetical protein [Clostridia bacterium]